MDWLKKLKPTRQKPAFEGAGHSSYREASPYDWESAYARLRMHFRIAVSFNVGLVILCVVLGNALASVFPLKEIRYSLLRIDPADNRIYRIQPLERDVEGFDIAMELMAKRYVENRLEIDSATQTLRMNEIQDLTARNHWNDFKDEQIESGLIQKAIDDGLSRDIEIKTAKLVRFFPDDNVWAWTVDFIRHDSYEGKAYQSVELTAHLNMTTQIQTASQAEREDNPLGIRVLDMVVKNPRIISNDPEQDYLR